MFKRRGLSPLKEHTPSFTHFFHRAGPYRYTVYFHFHHLVKCTSTTFLLIPELDVCYLYAKMPYLPRKSPFGSNYSVLSVPARLKIGTT